MKCEELSNFQEINYSECLRQKNDSFQHKSAISNSTEVQVGVFIDHIKELNIKDFKWIVDFHIWLKWQLRNASPLFSPQDNFRILNGYVNEDDLEVISEPKDEDREKFWRGHIVASITKDFDVRLYPCDTQYLTIAVEDIQNNISVIKYSADEKNSNISDRICLTGFDFKLLPPKIISVKYNTNFGEPNAIDQEEIYSQINFIIRMERSHKLILFLKLFQGLIVAVLVSILALRIKPTWVDPRFGLGVGGLFAAVASNYLISFSLPVIGIITLSGIVHGMGIAIIFLTLCQSTLSLFFYDEDGLNAKSLSNLFDFISFFIFLLIFIAMIVSIWLAAANPS